MSKLREAPIGVFDSGIGGLTVAREIMRQIPQERIVYFGDTARLPYGSKSRNTIIRYSRQIVRFLRTRQVKAIVVACNTASAYAAAGIRYTDYRRRKAGRAGGGQGKPGRKYRRYRHSGNRRKPYLPGVHTEPAAGSTGF